MENEKKNIDDLFKDGLGDYTEMPPGAVWERLEKKLDNVPAKKPGQYYRLLGYFAMVSLLLLIGVSVASNLTGSRSYIVKEADVNKINSNNASNNITTNNANNIHLTEKQSATNNDDKANNNDKKTAGPELLKKIAGNNDGLVNGKTRSTISETKQNKKALTVNKKKSSNKYAANHRHSSNRKGKGNNEPADQEVYNSTASARNPTNQNTKDQPGPSDKMKEEALTIPKKAEAKLPVDYKKQEPAKQKTHPYFPRFEAGVKAGYETGFNTNAAKKAVVSPYIQYNLTPKWSVMLQPAIKSAFPSSRIIGTPQSYYKVNNDGKIALLDSVPVIIPEGTGVYDTALWKRNYNYSQSHDSIIKFSSIGGTYMEFELPVLLKYAISKKFSVYGGINVIYSRLISITENTTVSQPITVTKAYQTTGENGQPAPAIPGLSSEITYSGTPISSYTGPQYQSVQTSMLRCGYMLGFTYAYEKRWLFDALVQQATVPANTQGGYNVNSTLSSAYLRLTIGYKLTK